MSIDLQATLASAKTIVGVLDAAGYKAHIVGGALRVLALGGETSDVDIAVLCDDFGDFDDLHNTITDIQTTLLLALGFKFDLKHQSVAYRDTEFLADLRSDNINIICYAGWKVPTVKDLVDGFDLNINQWYFDEDGELVNHHFVGNAVHINPKRDNPEQVNRLAERIARFKELYPTLDWSAVNA